jgi:hypothetical protein
LKKKCGILRAGVLGVSPKIEGYRGLIKTITAVSFKDGVAFV